MEIQKQVGSSRVCQRKVLGPFHKNFTSIVGPNGSGKSNVIDSMLFVFGYRAQKIRSKKISVLIHSSEQYPNVQSCTVTVHFQKIIDKENDEFDVLPNSSFSVSRTAFRDNSSYYQVDGKRCQFKAVAKLLRQYGIDLDHNRFLILQGEVEQIAMMKPKGLTEHDTGMLEFLEDIVGSSRFKEPIELLGKRVDDLNEARQEKLNRVKIVEKEKDELEGPKDEAVEHLRLENKITHKKHTLLQYRCWEYSEAVKKAEAKKEEISEGMSDIKKKLEELEEKKKEKEGEIHTLGKRLEKVNALKEESSEKFKALESEDVKMQEDLKHKNQKRKKLMAQLATDKNKLEELEKVPEKNEKSIEECVTLREQLEAKRKKEDEAYHKAMSTLNSETQQLQDEKAKYATQLIGLRKTVNETKSAVDIAQSELDIYQSTELTEKRKLEQILEGLEKASNTVETRRADVEKLDKAIPEYSKNLKLQQDKLLKTIPELQAVENELRTQRVKLEETRSAMHSSRSRGRVMDAVMEQKRNGNIKGVFGRLGDLGGIDEKYDVAISTACGALDNIVVDCVETGKRCISFLKQGNIGTATFIALDKMEKWRANCERSMTTPENVPRLYDLVRMSDDRVKTAFYFALRDTLVATDLDQASRISYQKGRHRVVTLNGELIEAVGTMSGGGKTVLRGRMGKQATVVNVDPQELQCVETRVEELTRRATELRKERGQLEDAVHQLSKDLRTMTQDCQKFKMEIDAAEQQLVNLGKQKGTQEQKVKSVKSDPAKIKVMEKDIAEKKKVYQKAAASAEEVEAEVTRIHNQIMQVTGGRMKELKKALDAITKRLEKVNAEITKLQISRLELADIPINKEEDDVGELVTLDPEELKEVDPKQLEYQVTVLQERLQESKPNLAVIQEYRKKEEMYLQRASELDEITRQRDEQRKYHEDLRKQRLNEFMAGFTIISNKLKEMYQMITLGGDAELELVDSLDPFSEGLIFSVRPPKKSWKNITNLSGGEKTLSSLALVFALHYYKPTPLYVMDEIDAALDFKNVSIVGNYVKERTKNAQFVIISLRSQMFELADRLVGIYKTYNTTKSVTINPAKIMASLRDECTVASTTLNKTVVPTTAPTAETHA
ncbi:Structural maintenance of chromosomes protein 4 [Portunus trituberculatus]|uniref:Structural maintenance of chromosomes protein 4 n=1 Tax=Portunus trituberculatus TaxID=210409 RepID=A0A5B7CIP4_PORTR|nr:Structural maintenance of chromosomes protein 4 [Portunus trituberculatus]